MLTTPQQRASAATALHGVPLAASDPESPLAPAAWTVADGEPIEGGRWHDPGGVLPDEMVRGCEDSVIQADARGRPVRRTPETPLTSFLTVDAVVEGLTVDYIEGSETERVELSEQTLIGDFMSVAVGEMGMIPIGKNGGYVWWTTFGYDKKRWEHVRARPQNSAVSPHIPSYSMEDRALYRVMGADGGVTVLGAWLDRLETSAKDEARRYTSIPVFRCQTEQGPAFCIGLTWEAEGLLKRLGVKPQRLTGTKRNDALRSRSIEPAV